MSKNKNTETMKRVRILNWEILNWKTLLTGLAGAILSLGTITAIAADDHGQDRGQSDGDDFVILSFSTVGDSRQDPDTPDPTTLPLSGQDKIWLENTKAFSRIIDSVNEQGSLLLFFNGDMIMGYGNATNPANNSISTVVKSDLMQFYRQYAFWRGMVAGLMEKGTYVVPVPGNHETQWKKGGKIATTYNEDAWRANMSDLILDTNRFQQLFTEQPANINTNNNGPLDGLISDQSQLSYSFDFHAAHFAIMNTDPVGNDAHAPANWLSNDLAAAQSRGFVHLFVFGHKPAYTYFYGANAPVPPATLPLPGKYSGLDNDLVARDAFWNVIEYFRAIYFCGHEHIFNMSQPLGGAWQVLVGSGGSPFEAFPTDATISPTDRYYAWATVQVFRSGKVRITAYGFDDGFGPTRILESVIF
jgi:hypothetical protein